MGQPEKEPYFLKGAGRNENMGKISGFTAVSHSRTTYILDRAVIDLIVLLTAWKRTFR
jgi:hypothetical protein